MCMNLSVVIFKRKTVVNVGGISMQYTEKSPVESTVVDRIDVRSLEESDRVGDKAVSLVYETSSVVKPSLKSYRILDMRKRKK